MEQEEELDNSLPENYSTEGQPLTDSGFSAAALSQWSDVTARAIDAQRAQAMELLADIRRGAASEGGNA